MPVKTSNLTKYINQVFPETRGESINQPHHLKGTGLQLFLRSARKPNSHDQLAPDFDSFYLIWRNGDSFKHRMVAEVRSGRPAEIKDFYQEGDHLVVVIGHTWITPPQYMVEIALYIPLKINFSPL